MPHLLHLRENWKTNRGAVLLIVTVSMVALFAVASLAVDFGYLMVIKNQLQNAAEAGALRGAQMLYDSSGQVINENANQEGYLAAIENDSQRKPVEVDDPGTTAASGGGGVDNSGDVQRGHWSFADHTFTPNASTAVVDLFDRPTSELDADTNFINAVRVRSHRAATPAYSFFSRILGYDSFQVGAEAVAYIGFAGTLRPFDVDQPIAICEQFVRNEDDEYSCNTGRMINSSGSTTNNTGGWTDFDQPESCTGGASASSVRPLVCGDGNPDTISLGDEMQVSGGQIQSAYSALYDCWRNRDVPKDANGFPINSWIITLPVVECPSNNPGPCSRVVGAVTVEMVWMIDSTDSHYDRVPVRMTSSALSWTCPAALAVAGSEAAVTSLDIHTQLTEAQRLSCWQDFTATKDDSFNLQTWDGVDPGTMSPSNLQKTMYFLPNCDPQEPRGVTGGENFGILADVPVLVH